MINEKNVVEIVSVLFCEFVKKKVLPFLYLNVFQAAQNWVHFITDTVPRDGFIFHS